MEDRLCILTVHAYPDDEASKGAGTIARYHAEGIRTVLVTCTGGEEGDILNPAMDSVEVRARLHEKRLEELEAAAKIIGYDEVVLLGYRDSGMPDSEANADTRSFAQAPLEEAVGRLVRVIRTERPQVIVTYSDNQSGYQHPDHIRVHEISVAAFEVAGDPDAYPEAGPAFTPFKLYYTAHMREAMLERHRAFLAEGIESPYAKRLEDGWLERFEPDVPTAFVDLAGFEQVRLDALRAHETQVDPLSGHWFGLPIEVEHAIYSRDAYVLAQNRLGPIGIEEDLFAGVREAAVQH